MLTKSNPLQCLISNKPGMAAATYEYILSGPGASIFAVDQQGYVYLNVPSVDADPPNPSSYALNIEAREVNTTPIRISESITVTIYIVDMNDNVPTFSSPVYFANVSASGPDRPVIEIFAEDNDSGKLAEIDYRIVSVTNGAFGNFRYDPVSKQLIAMGTLVPSERYQVVLEARDGGGLWSQATVVVLAIGDVAPPQGLPMGTFSEFPKGPIETSPTDLAVNIPPANVDQSSESVQTFVTEISEATPPYSIVLTLGDEATRGRVFFTITNGNEAGKFAIDEETGTILTVETFDRESAQMYNLQIDASSRNPPQHLYWTIVQVAVLDVNDNAPEFVDPVPIQMIADLSGVKELEPNMFVGKITVQDSDSQDNGRVHLRILPPMDKSCRVSKCNYRLFTVGDDGSVTVKGNVTSAHFGQHHVVFVASDNGEPPLETKADATITVNGRQMTQKTELPDIGSTADNYPTIQYTITRQPFTAQEITDRSQEELFTVVPSSNLASMPVITMPSSTQPPFIGPERAIPHHFETWIAPDLTASSNASQLPSVPITTTPPAFLTPRPAPVFDPSKITVTVNEGESSAGITKVSAHYPDNMPGQITYVLTLGDPSLFAVDGDTGVIRLLRPLNAESDSTYQIHVSTAQALQLNTGSDYAHEAIVEVNVKAANKLPPSFESTNYSFTLPSSSLPGTVLGQVIAFHHDKDASNNRIQYGLVSAGGFEDAFSINPDNGIITLERSIEPSGNSEQILVSNKRMSLTIEGFVAPSMLTVEAMDQDEPSVASEAIVVINVEDQRIPSTSQTTPEPFDVPSAKNALRFSSRSYT
ncbi:unnamed protein product [Anisakis simplex]|uniref:Protocadherin-15 (inferred by orthology to a human protein) n=1 Tax=Anisakis simplex TaxID=6269 RepID=A0A0M3IZ81_ANISI|nr:unnamed protein product [Anisakis simplex]